ncbi:MAG TPA: type II toxin-antitoxin system HicB family antitoxin [Gemmataceae bacterium]|nr:type II toxin-antitoxin system HicB family antitoxin [Gemmataceae bacterium]
MMEYKGYTGQITGVDEKQGLIHGRVANLNDVITFEGKTYKELRQAFHDSVEDYLEFCEQLERPPEKPLSGKILLRISPELHKQATLAAKKNRQSLNAWIGSAIQAQVEKGRSARKEHENGPESEDLNRLLGLLELHLVRELRGAGEASSLQQEQSAGEH